MSEPRRLLLHFNYEEERARFSIDHDPAANRFTLRGGRHAYTKLVEFCALLAMSDASYDHIHWPEEAEQLWALTVMLTEELKVP